MELKVEGLWFSAAHRLMHHPGKCSHLHGHNFHVEAVLYGEETDPETGMLADFGDVKEVVKAAVDSLDHLTILNIDDKKYVDFLRKQEDRLVVLGNEPTCEEIAKFLFRKLDEMVDNNSKLAGKLCVSLVRIWETPKFSATYTLSDATGD